MAGEPPPADVVATLLRTGCRGACASYSVTVLSDGRVRYVGDRFVKVRGPASARLRQAELKSLRTAFAAARYLDLEDPSNCVGAIPDYPSVATSYDSGRRKREINHYLGCRSKPNEVLEKLEDRFDKIVKSARWVGTARERESRQD